MPAAAPHGEDGGRRRQPLRLAKVLTHLRGDGRVYLNYRELKQCMRTPALFSDKLRRELKYVDVFWQQAERRAVEELAQSGPQGLAHIRDLRLYLVVNVVSALKAVSIHETAHAEARGSGMQHLVNTNFYHALCESELFTVQEPRLRASAGLPAESPAAALGGLLGADPALRQRVAAAAQAGQPRAPCIRVSPTAWDPALTAAVELCAADEAAPAALLAAAPPPLSAPAFRLDVRPKQMGEPGAAPQEGTPAAAAAPAAAGSNSPSSGSPERAAPPAAAEGAHEGGPAASEAAEEDAGRGQPQSYYCRDCCMVLNSFRQAQIHVGGQRHQDQVHRLTQVHAAQGLPYQPCDPQPFTGEATGGAGKPRRARRPRHRAARAQEAPAGEAAAPSADAGAGCADAGTGSTACGTPAGRRSPEPAQPVTSALPASPVQPNAAGGAPQPPQYNLPARLPAPPQPPQPLQPPPQHTPYQGGMWGAPAAGLGSPLYGAAQAWLPQPQQQQPYAAQPLLLQQHHHHSHNHHHQAGVAQQQPHFFGAPPPFLDQRTLSQSESVNLDQSLDASLRNSPKSRCSGRESPQCPSLVTSYATTVHTTRPLVHRALFESDQGALEQLRSLITTPGGAHEVVDEVFEGVLGGHGTRAYSQLCRDIVKCSSDADHEGSLFALDFQHVLVTRCRQEISVDVIPVAIGGNTQEEAEREERALRMKFRRANAVRFVTELYLVRIVPEALVHVALHHLLFDRSVPESADPAEADPGIEEISAAARVIKSAGTDLLRTSPGFIALYANVLRLHADRSGSSRVRRLVASALEVCVPRDPAPGAEAAR